MPSHPDRVRRNYHNICTKCNKNPIALFASDTYLAINRTNLCADCLYEIKQELIIRNLYPYDY